MLTSTMWGMMVLLTCGIADMPYVSVNSENKLVRLIMNLLFLNALKTVSWKQTALLRSSHLTIML